MIKVFVVHSGSDYQYIQDYVEPFLEGKIDIDGNKIAEPNPSKVSLLSLDSKPKNWKYPALKKLKQAQVVLFLMGKDDQLENKKDTIGWEIGKARKLNKIILLHKLDPSMKCPSYFYHNDPFTSQEHAIAKHMTLTEIKNRIEKFDAGDYDIYSSWFQTIDDHEREKYNDAIIEQYRLYQKSSEDLVLRRQNVNSFYQALNGILIPMLIAVSGIFNESLKIQSQYFVDPHIAIMMVAFVGLVLDYSWFRLLDSYGKLNSAKMKVLNLLEQQLPFEIYKVEWDVMTDRLNNKPYKSFTTTEKWTPILFCILYLFCIVVNIVHFCM